MVATFAGFGTAFVGLSGWSGEPPIVLSPAPTPFVVIAGVPFGVPLSPAPQPSIRPDKDGGKGPDLSGQLALLGVRLFEQFGGTDLGGSQQTGPSPAPSPEPSPRPSSSDSPSPTDSPWP